MKKVFVTLAALAISAYACFLLYRHIGSFGYVCADDAYISFRYAENLANGRGLVYNPDERVEGFSNPLWTFTLALSTAMGFKIERASRELGFFFSVIALLASLLLAVRLSNSKFIVPLATGLMLTGSTSFVLYSTSGLETAQYGFVLVLSAYLATSKNPILRALVSILGLLAALSRPEGVLVSILLWAIAVWRILQAYKSERTIIGVGLALSILGFFGFLLLRYQYFGDIYPNTYYAKPTNWLVGVESISDLRKNMLNANTGFHGGLVLAILIVGAAAISLSYGWIASAGIVLCGLVFLYYASIDWMPFARFFAPYHPVFCAASTASIYALANKKPASTPCSPLPPNANGRAFSLWRKLVCAALALMIGSLPQVLFGLDLKRFVSKSSKLPYHVVSGHFVRYVAKELNKLIDNIEPYSISVATKRIGAVGYFCPVKIDDLYGLVDKSVAQIYHKHSNSKNTSARDGEVAALILARNPEMVLIFSESPFKDPKDPYKNKDLNKLESIQRQTLKAALARRYYFEKGFRKGNLAAYLYLHPDFTLQRSRR